MKQNHAKVPCQFCKREFDVRGIAAHEHTHNKNNVERETPMTKRGPVSVDLASFRIGFQLGREIEKVA